MKWCLIFLGIIGFFLGFFWFVKEPPFTPHPFVGIGEEHIAFENTEVEEVKKYTIGKPEDIAVFPSEGVFYSGLVSGSVVRVDIESGIVFEVLKPIDFNPEIIDVSGYDEKYCDGNPFSWKYCGVIYGIKFSGDYSQLVIANVIFGIFILDMDSNTLKKVVDNNRRDSGGILEFYDDVTFGEGEYSNKIYYTKVSDHFSYEEMFNVIWENVPGGSIMEFNLDTNEETTLLDGIYFPNGILTVGRFLYFTDMTRPSLFKIDLETREVVDVMKLELIPDNLSYDEVGGKVYIAGTERSRILEKMGNWPSLVQILTVHPIVLALTTLSLLNSHTGLICEVDVDRDKMEVSGYVYDGTGENYKGLTSVYVHEGYFYVGTFFHNQVVRFKVKGDSLHIY